MFCIAYEKMVVSALKCDTMDYTNTKDKTASLKIKQNIKAVGCNWSYPS